MIFNNPSKLVKIQNRGPEQENPGCDLRETDSIETSRYERKGSCANLLILANELKIDAFAHKL